MEMALEVEQKPRKWIYFLRQLLICSGVWTNFFMVGQFLGTPTVLIPQLRRHSTETLDKEMVSWVYSVFGLAALPWVVLLSTLTKLFGLRIPYIAGCVGLFIAYTVLYISTSLLQILISEIVFGIGYASVLTIGIVVISDYTSPEYRGMFLTIKSASLFWGMWSANTLGTFFYWKTIAYSGLICSIYTFTFVFWPESPQWLARKHRFDDCRKAYFWLQGRNKKTEKEVEELIASQVKAGVDKHYNDWSNISNAVRTIKSKQFYKPIALIALLITQYHLAGKFVCAIYVVDILKKMTDNESTAYTGMLVLDGVTLASMYFGCFLVKILNRRTLYFTATSIGITFLLIISLYLYLVKLAVIGESRILSVVLLTCYSIAMGCGPMIINLSLYVEFIPLRFKSVMVLFAALLFYASISLVLKIAPLLFKSFGYHGSFLFFGLSTGICTVLLYLYLPETKDKTLQEIEESFTTHKASKETEKLTEVTFDQNR